MSASSLPRVSIIGVGGVGGVLASSLRSAKKCFLTLVSRGSGLDTLRSRGLTVTTFEGRTYRTTLNDEFSRVVSFEEVAAGAIIPSEEAPQDYVLVATKSHQLPSTLRALRRLAGPRTAILPCTNGLPWWFHRPDGLKSVDPDGSLEASIPVDTVMGTVGMVSGNVVGNYDRWESRWPSERNVLTIGEASSPPSSSGFVDPKRGERLADLFRGGEIEVTVETVPDIRSRIYDKVLINCGMNTVGAICGVDCGTTAEPGSASSRLVRELIDEARAVASRLDDPVELTLDADSILDIYRGQYGLETSMLRDVRAGRKTEVDAIARAVSELGRIHGVSTPRLDFACDVIETLERVYDGAKTSPREQ